MKYLVLAIFWFFSAAVVTVGAVTLAADASWGKDWDRVALQFNTTEHRFVRTTPTPPVSQQLAFEASAGDARELLVQNFLERHTSPIVAEDPEFAQFLVELADEYEIDFRLLPAIAMQESNLCKVIPPDSHNCLGLGVHSRGTWGFDTYRDNFTAAAKVLKKNYLDIGLTTPEEIETKYNPTSANRDGSWAASINQWMAEMRYDDRDLGRERRKNDADLLEFLPASPAAEAAPTSSDTPAQ